MRGEHARGEHARGEHARGEHAVLQKRGRACGGGWVESAGEFYRQKHSVSYTFSPSRASILGRPGRL
eukprot:6038488-Pyramimonas_sp.AAC.1